MFVLCGDPKYLPVHSFNAFIIPVLRDWFTQLFFSVFLTFDVPRRIFCFDSSVVLDVMCGYVLLFLLDIKIENT